MENVMIIPPHSQLRSAQALAAYWFMQAAQAGLDEAQYQISRQDGAQNVSRRNIFFQYLFWG